MPTSAVELRSLVFPPSEQTFATWVENRIGSPEVRDKLRGYLIVLCEDCGAVDDLTQEVLLRCLQRVERLHTPEKLSAFLYGIARHVVQEQERLRKKDRLSARIAAEELTARAARARHATQRRYAIDDLHVAISRLPLVSRRILELRYSDGLTAAQIGRRMDIKPAAVRTCLRRIRQRLKRDLHC